MVTYCSNMGRSRYIIVRNSYPSLSLSPPSLSLPLPTLSLSLSPPSLSLSLSPSPPLSLQANFFFSFFIFGFFMNQSDMFASFGFPDSRPIIVGLIIVFELVFTPYNMLYSFVMVQLIRRFEYQADEFAQGMGKGRFLSSALVKLVKDNLGFPIADPLYSNFNHTHPTVLERVRALKKKVD